MMIERKVFFISMILFFTGFSTGAWASPSSHDFRSQVWAKGRSCAICHVIRAGALSLAPPGARVVDVAHLNPGEAQAVELHPSNRLCYVCHQTNVDPNVTAPAHSIVGNPTPGGLPTFPSGPPLPPSVGGGTFGSICVRVNNQGAKGMDCLGCHDVHNYMAPHFLRADYGQALIRP